MPTAAANKSRLKDDKPRAVQAQIQDAHRRMKREALGKWRAWARAIADGGDIPNPLELLSSASLLGIAAPADALEQDAQALREIDQADRAIELCLAEQGRLIEPWAGDRSKLVAAVEAAEAEAKRLREILASFDGGCGEPYWHAVAGQIRSRHRRAFAEFEEQLVSQGEDQE